jgi:hypothetical protein
MCPGDASITYYTGSRQTRGKRHGNGSDLSARQLAPAVPVPTPCGPKGSRVGLDAVPRYAPRRPPAAHPLAAGGGLPAGHQRAICPAQPDHPGDLSRVRGHHRGDAGGAEEESPDPLPLQRQTLLPAALARSGGELGTRADRLADGARAALRPQDSSQLD